MHNPFDLTNVSETQRGLDWDIRDPSHAKGRVWSLIVVFAHTFSFNYNYLRFYLEQRNANCGWYKAKERYIPLPTPTKADFLETLEFRKSELMRILEGTASAADLYERLEQEGEVSGPHWRASTGIKWNQWHWPPDWGYIGWNTCIACGDFFYRIDPEEYIRIKERLNDTTRAIEIHKILWSHAATNFVIDAGPP